MSLHTNEGRFICFRCFSSLFDGPSMNGWQQYARSNLNEWCELGEGVGGKRQERPERVRKGHRFRKKFQRQQQRGKAPCPLSSFRPFHPPPPSHAPRARHVLVVRLGAELEQALRSALLPAHHGDQRQRVRMEPERLLHVHRQKVKREVGEREEERRDRLSTCGTAETARGGRLATLDDRQSF